MHSPGCAAVRLVVRGEYVIRLLLAHTHPHAMSARSANRIGRFPARTIRARIFFKIDQGQSSPCMCACEARAASGQQGFFRSPCGWPLAGACAPPWPHCCLLWWTKALRMRQKEATMQLATVGQPNSITAKVMVWHAPPPPTALRSRCTPQQLSSTFAPREWIRRCVSGPLVCVAAFLSALHSLYVIISLWYELRVWHCVHTASWPDLAPMAALRRCGATSFSDPLLTSQTNNRLARNRRARMHAGGARRGRVCDWEPRDVGAARGGTAQAEPRQ